MREKNQKMQTLWDTFDKSIDDPIETRMSAFLFQAESLMGSEKKCSAMYVN